MNDTPNPATIPLPPQSPAQDTFGTWSDNETSFVVESVAPPPEPAPDVPAPAPAPTADAEDEIDFTKLPAGVAKRVARANKQRDEAIANAAELAAQVKALNKPADPVAASQPTDVDPNDYDSMDEYNAALKAAKEKPAAPAPAAAKPSDMVDGVPRPAYLSAVAQLRDMVEGQDPTLWERASLAVVDISASMVTLLAENDAAPDILRRLLADPAESTRISKLSLSKQSLELAKMATTPRAPAPEQRISKAPAPIEAAKGNASPVVDLDRLARTDFSAFERAQEAQEQSRNGW